jgi:phasin family protein
MPDDGKTAHGPRPTSLPLPGLSFGGVSLASQRAFENWAHGMSKLSHEMAEFMQARLHEDAAMWEKLAACRDPNAALDLQRQFTAKASADYLAASQKFARLVIEIGQACSAGLRQTPPETD